MKTLYEQLLPQALELIEKRKMRFPATMELLIDTLKNEKYLLWTELPYYAVKMLHETVFNAKSFELIEEEEIRMLFEGYYNE